MTALMDAPGFAPFFMRLMRHGGGVASMCLVDTVQGCIRMPAVGLAAWPECDNGG